MYGLLNNNKRQMKLKAMMIKRIQIIIKINQSVMNNFNYLNMINKSMNKNKHSKYKSFLYHLIIKTKKYKLNKSYSTINKNKFKIII